METKNPRRQLSQLRVWWIGVAALIVLAAVWSTRNNAGPDRTLRELGRAIIAGDDLLIDQYINYSKVTPSLFADWAAVSDSNAALAPPPALMLMFQQPLADELQRSLRPGGDLFEFIFVSDDGGATAAKNQVSLLTVRTVNGLSEAEVAFSDSLTDTTFKARLRLEREADKKWRVVGVSGVGVAITALRRKREEFVDSVNSRIFDGHEQLIRVAPKTLVRIDYNDNAQFVGFYATLRNTSTRLISAVVFGIEGPGIAWDDIPIRVHLSKPLQPGDTASALGVFCAEGPTARVRRVWLDPRAYRPVLVGMIAASDTLLPFRSWEDYHARRYIVPEEALRRNCGEYVPGPSTQESQE